MKNTIRLAAAAVMLAGSMLAAPKAHANTQACMSALANINGMAQMIQQCQAYYGCTASYETCSCNTLQVQMAALGEQVRAACSGGNAPHTN